MSNIDNSVPYADSRFIMNEACACGSATFTSDGGVNLTCTACGRRFKAGPKGDTNDALGSTAEFVDSPISDRALSKSA